MDDAGRVMRADLHVHSYHSGYAGHMRFLRARDCYSEPESVYRVAKARGMDIVTLTDHDSIDGCLEFLDRHPGADDFFISEEIECLVPWGRRSTGSGLPLKVHIGAYGIDERIHREIQPLRANVYEAAAYLREQGVFYTLNHLFFFLRRQMPLDVYLRALLPVVPGLRGAERHDARGAQHAYRGGPRRPGAHGMARDRGRRQRRAHAGGRGHDLHRSARPDHGRVPAEPARRIDVGWRHGTAAPLRVMREIYGVVGRYWASLAGVGRQELSWPRRAIGIGFSTLSMPAEFTPALIAVDRQSRRAAPYRSLPPGMGAVERDGAIRHGRGWQAGRSGPGSAAGPHDPPR